GDEASGSGRSIAGFHLLEALESMPDLFSRFGGHKQAAGLTLPSARVAELRERLNAFARSRLTADDLRPSLEIDAVMDLAELDEPAVEEILDLAPFGFGNPAPLFAAREIEVARPPEIRNEKHVFVWLKSQGSMFRAKAWNFAGRAGEMQAGARIDAAFQIEEDDYSARRGGSFWQITLRDVHACTRAAEIGS
ncbi:MAG: DHHA1 domain-containing protein, partial [Terracidiphilus sp.]